MIIKNIYKIHPFYFIMAFIALFTGLFKKFIIISIIFIVHELGHIIGALIFKWKIDKIIILPFGCLTIFKEHLNKPLYEELIITLLGPLFQLFTLKLSLNYNLSILIFNLLPIFPLDGSKILNVIFNKFFCFKKSHLLTVYISFLVLIILLLNIKINFIVILIVLFLIIKLISEFKNHNLVFNKFLLERYLYNFKFKKIKRVETVKDMFRSYYHIFRNEEESEMLKKRFK